ncbi:MAG: hypothetical protein J6V40_00905 [Clostridia bacterium]|nr:hypothetical protein [Clostridia bacterium]
MKELMSTNIYDCDKEIIIVGTCLKQMQPEAYKELEAKNMPMFNLCLEESHINMAITKILGMIRAQNITKIIFASVDRSPHCIQLHYIQDEIRKLGFNLVMENYVAIDNKLEYIDSETISLSKNLFKLKNR